MWRCVKTCFRVTVVTVLKYSILKIPTWKNFSYCLNGFAEKFCSCVEFYTLGAWNKKNLYECICTVYTLSFPGYDRSTFPLKSSSVKRGLLKRHALLGKTLQQWPMYCNAPYRWSGWTRHALWGMEGQRDGAKIDCIDSFLFQAHSLHIRFSLHLRSCIRCIGAIRILFFVNSVCCLACLSEIRIFSIAQFWNRFGPLKILGRFHISFYVRRKKQKLFSLHIKRP